MSKIRSENQFRITLTLEGNSLGTWDKDSGGTAGSNTTTYPPGGMAPTEAISGTQTMDTITVSRAFDLDRDGPLMATLYAARGKGAMKFKKQPLDDDGNAYGDAIVRTGILATVAEPSTDSTSTSVGMLVLTITADGTVSA